jgi:peptide/nickel transport system substrate-binding protein
MGGLNIRDRKSGLAYWSLSAALAVTLGIGSFNQALAQESDPDATINIGSLYEPQNLDNTAGAGQGINEAFNGNVYEALFRLADDGKVEPVLSKDYSVSDDGLTIRSSCSRA